MKPTRLLALSLGLFFLLCAAGTASAAPFTVLTYNMKGLPAMIEVEPGVFVPGNPDSPVAVPQIETALQNNITSFDVVAIQEAFDPGYYADIAATGSNAPPFDPPSGGALAGSGLLRLSQDPYSDYAREGWNTCGPNRDDCAANKGFSRARHTVMGETVDIYNLHGDAGQEALDFAARADQLDQLAAHIDAFSAGNAVIVLGDTNSLFNRVGDSLPSFLTSTGLADTWVELMNGGNVPLAGSMPLPGCTNDAETDGAGCERIDKVLFRNSATLALNPTAYDTPTGLFDDDMGDQLTDHLPVVVTFDAQVIPEPGTATLLMAGLVGLAARRKRA